MQERWLSPRVLHYGRDQLLWECSELDACEAYPGGLPKHLKNGGSGFKLDPELLKPLDDAPPSDPGLLHRGTWNSIVSKYSATSLTKGEDRLVAISGIAKRMQALLDDVYLAGLWRKDLASQLLWFVDSLAGLALPRPRPYRAPSWSWASVDEQVVGGDYREDDGILITVLDAGVTPVGTDSTGQIKDGFIRLNGRLFAAELVRDPVSYSTLRVNSEDLEGIYYYFPDIELQALDTLIVYSLPIRSYSYENEPCIDGLVLQAAAQGNGTYERIGTYFVSGEKSCTTLNQSQALKDKSLYEDANGETIVLI